MQVVAQLGVPKAGFFLCCMIIFVALFIFEYRDIFSETLEFPSLAVSPHETVSTAPAQNTSGEPYFTISETLSRQYFSSSCLYHKHDEVGSSNLCHFQNIAIDAIRVYLEVEQGTNLTIAREKLDECCGGFGFVREATSSKNCDQAFVSPDFCRCIGQKNRVPVLVRNVSKLEVSSVFSSAVYVMYHHATVKHMYHFDMGALPFLFWEKYSATYGLPHFSTLVSQDYPLIPWNGYENAVFESVFRFVDRPNSIDSCYTWRGKESVEFAYSISATRDQIYQNEYGTTLNINKTLEAGKRFFFRSAYWPVEPTIFPTVEAGVLAKQVFGNKNSEKVDCNVKIVFLGRHDGNGRRRFVNLDRVLAIAEKVFLLFPFLRSTINVAFPSALWDTKRQVDLFQSFDILVSPHSGQLSLLKYSTAGSVIIEVLPSSADGTGDYFHFSALSKVFDLNHFFLLHNTPAAPSTNGFRADDMIVNETEFENLLQKVLIVTKGRRKFAECKF